MSDDKCAECGHTIAECNARATARLTAMKLGPFSVDRAGFVWGRSEKGGLTVVANVRGWGYLTGKGHGALGLSDDEASAEQAAWGDMIVRALNALVEEKRNGGSAGPSRHAPE